MIYLIDKIALSNRLKIYGFDRRSPQINVYVVSMQFRNAANFLSHFWLQRAFYQSNERASVRRRRQRRPKIILILAEMKRSHFDWTRSYPRMFRA